MGKGEYRIMNLCSRSLSFNCKYNMRFVANNPKEHKLKERLHRNNCSLIPVTLDVKDTFVAPFKVCRGRSKLVKQ